MEQMPDADEEPQNETTEAVGRDKRDERIGIPESANPGVSQEEHEQKPPRRGSGIYVDLENLQADGQTMLQSLFANWPEQVPLPSRLRLYTRADQVELWWLWASHRFSDLEVTVHGTQHFSGSASKNSADMAIVANAMADLVLGRTTHVVVFSDDSDFISLYAAIRDEPGIPCTPGKVPFLWVVTDREGLLSTTVKRFFPPEELHVVTNNRTPEVHTPAKSQQDSQGSIWSQIAQAVLQDIPPGQFKSTDCQPIIKRQWPTHSLAKAGGAAFGTEFKNKILPILQEHGVSISNPGGKPVRYEMPDNPVR